MANPCLGDGHIRIANELWFAWMQDGPNIERVRKAIVWECWGFADRREAKLPVPIQRGTIAKLTGITDKPLISRLIAKLVKENKILKHSNGPLQTAAYWPNQDYESWIKSTSDDLSSSVENDTIPRDESSPIPSGQNVPTPRDESVPIPRDESSTIYMNKKNNKQEEQAIAVDDDPASLLASSRIIYCKYVLNGNKLKHRELDRFSAMFEELPGQFNCSAQAIYNAIFDWFHGHLPNDDLTDSETTPHSQWQDEKQGERLGVTLLRLKVEDALKHQRLWSERIAA